MTLVRVSCRNSLHNQTALQPELSHPQSGPPGIECSGTQNSKFCPCKQPQSPR